MATVRIIAAGVLVVFTAFAAAAQDRPVAAEPDFPNRPVRIVVPFPPGGPLDIITRVYAQRLGEEWKQPVQG